MPKKKGNNQKKPNAQPSAKPAETVQPAVAEPEVAEPEVNVPEVAEPAPPAPTAPEVPQKTPESDEKPAKASESGPGDCQSSVDNPLAGNALADPSTNQVLTISKKEADEFVSLVNLWTDGQLNDEDFFSKVTPYLPAGETA